MKISVILPAHNEEKNIGEAIERTEERLRELNADYEIIVAEDGSRDRTYEIALSYSRRNRRIRALHSEERLGRGEALKRAFKVADGDILLYMDVDLATDLSHIADVLKLMEHGYDIVIGSRKSPLSKRAPSRRLLSWCYNLWVRAILGSKIRDHQCGFKAFRREKILEVLDEVRDNGWFWDTEILVRAQRKGMRIAELPVRWNERGDSKVRVLRDSLEMWLSTLLLRFELMKVEGRWSAGPLLVAILLLALITFFSGFENVIGALKSVKAETLLLASILYLLSWPLRGLRYSKILERMGYRISVLSSTSLIFLSQSLNIVLPGRIGDLSRAYLLKRDSQIPLISSISSLLSERIFDVLSIGILGLISVLLLGIELSQKSSIVFLVTILLISALILLIIFIQFSGSSRIFFYLQKLIRDARTSFERRIFISLTLLSFILWILEALVCYVLLASLFPSSFLLAVIAVSFGNLTKVLPITPGGIGTYEAGVTAILTSGGVPPGMSFTVALLDHALKNLITLIFGALSLKHLNITFEALKRGVRTVEPK